MWAPSLLAASLVAAGPSGCFGTLQYLSMYDYDPAAQAGWLTLGKTDNMTLLAEGWAKYRIPSLIELSQGAADSLWCSTNKSLRPCGGRGSATFAARLVSFAGAVRPHMKSGACVGVFLGDELMAADGASWEDLSFVADSLRSVMGPKAILYENDAFHQGLIDMPHVPSSLNWFSADGCYGWACPFDSPTGLRTAYEQRQARLFASRVSADAERGVGLAAGGKGGKNAESESIQPQMVRSLPVVGSVCVSRMEIGQRSINFGECEAYTSVEKSIILHNRAAVPLLYKIDKTGRHASFDVMIRSEDRRGCVRPFGSRQVRFVFRPSLAGEYRETLSIHNVQDKDDVQPVTLKAKVKRAEPFLVKAPNLEFGPLLLNKPCHEIRRFVVVNVS